MEVIILAIKVKLIRKVEESFLKDFWNIFYRCFTDLDEKGEAIERQVFFTEEEIKEIALDEDYAKFIAFKNREMVGYIIGTNKIDKIEKISYINPRFFAKRYPQEVQEERFYFSPIICNLLYLLYCLSILWN